MRSKMEYSFLDLLCAALIPELGTDVSACSSGHVKLILVVVTAVRAYPCKLVISLFDLDLAVKAANLAVIGLCIKLCIHDVVVDILHNIHDCIDVVLHVRYFDVADSSAGRESLELGLKGKLLKCIDLLGYMNMVAVRDVVPVSNTLYYAESSLKSLSELICRGLKRCAVDRVVDVLFCLPLGTGGIKSLHYLKTECLALGLGKLLARYFVYALPKACIAE